MLGPELLERLGLRTPETLRERVGILGASEYVVKDLLNVRSIGLVIGDSGLGKSPLMYQAAICVAAGIPFLGHETRKGPALIADFENGLADMQELLEQISRYLGLRTPPSKNLLLWSLNDCAEGFGKPGHTLPDIIRQAQPSLVIIDSLASFQPEAEEKTKAATEMLQEFRAISRDYGTSFLITHHRRKQPRRNDEGAGALETANLRRWFEDSRGAGALVNGSDVRLGVDEPDLEKSSKDDVALVIRGFGRIRGEIGPIYIARDSDEHGDPCGYRVLSGVELLFNLDHQKAFTSLPSAFSFKDAKVTYGKSDQPTTNFLRHCIVHGLLKRVGRGRYEKTDLAAPEPRE